MKDDDGDEGRQVLRHENADGVDSERQLRTPLLQADRVEHIIVEQFDLMQAVHHKDRRCHGDGEYPDERQAAPDCEMDAGAVPSDDDGVVTVDRQGDQRERRHEDVRRLQEGHEATQELADRPVL